MAQIARAEPGLVCPLHKQDMAEVCHKCPWWIHLRGPDPQTGNVIDKWGCAVGYLPTLLIENAQMQRQTGAAVESFRNEMVDGVVQAVGAAIEGVAAQARALAKD